MKISYNAIIAGCFAVTVALPVNAESHIDAGTLTCSQFVALNSDDQVEALHSLMEMSGEMAKDEMSSDDAMASDDAMESDDAMASDDAMESDDAMASDDAIGADSHTLNAVLSTCTANLDMMAADAVELG